MSRIWTRTTVFISYDENRYAYRCLLKSDKHVIDKNNKKIIHTVLYFLKGWLINPFSLHKKAEIEPQMSWKITMFIYHFGNQRIKISIIHTIYIYIYISTTYIYIYIYIYIYVWLYESYNYSVFLCIWLLLIRITFFFQIQRLSKNVN